MTKEKLLGKYKYSQESFPEVFKISTLEHMSYLIFISNYIDKTPMCIHEALHIALSQQQPHYKYQN